MILYPVERRTKEVLIPIIKRHVKQGATIYTDGWSSYLDLNHEGFDHFTVNHKHTFSQTYKNRATGKSVTVHTNRVEGSWANSKHYFKYANNVIFYKKYKYEICLSTVV